MNNISLLSLYLIFVKLGAILLGGGYVILPIATREFVDKRNFIHKDELLDLFALAQTLPGIIAANLSMFIGYKLRKKTGALLAMLGIITVPFIVIVVFASVLKLIANNLYIEYAFDGIQIAVIALIMLTIREFFQNTEKDFFFYFIFLLALITLLFLNLSPIKTILIILPIGIVLKMITKNKEVK